MSPTATLVEVDADLRVELTGLDGQSARGHLYGEANHFTFELDHPGVFAGSDDAPTVAAAAEMFAERGITIKVVSDGVHLVTIGAVRAPWWQRRATGSRHIRVGTWRGGWTALRSRAAGQPPVLPSSKAFPPPSMLPVAPTFGFRRRRLTGTDSPGAGSPRLAVERASVMAGETQSVFWLQGDVVGIGSDPSNAVVLPGIEPFHAVINRDAERDELVISTAGPEVRVHGELVREKLLRSGSRIEIGEHTLAYYRDEHADHGRPYGGRQGGEMGRQRPQPGR
ncbi:FHA domain-containing protein [Nocardioides aurantiacus]|uniref:FHA domain-containing protein n=1 Tax=Nocardioides aurantiacus TaxID=86796 RepID=A0A3N2CVQ9_9ACTN|nr:FHA domain-containing protein [Nocardioides aurantiacus]ROR91579.1 hypothetical protein EDD33_2449 [Nocardioides aurantiacus]